MQTRRPEILPALVRAESLVILLERHPEAAEFYTSFYGNAIIAEIHQAGQSLREGIYNPAALEELISTIEARLRRLSAPLENWN
jgi:hypothetical protein